MASEEADKLLPVYELVLRSQEPPDETPKSVHFERNQSAIIKCTLGDSGFEPGTLHFSRGHENITKEGTAISYSYTLRDYQLNFQPLTFRCSAQRRSGKNQKRSMNIFPKTDKTIPPDAELCGPEIDLTCHNHGFCVKPKNDDNPYCICTGIFSGSQCEHIQIGKTLIDVSRTQGRMTENILYSSIAFLAVIALIFAVLFGREKVKRMRTKRQLRESTYRRPIITHQNEQHENSSLQHYEFCDGPDLEGGYTDIKKETKTMDKEVIVSEYDNLTPEQNRRLGRDRLHAVSSTPDSDTPPSTANGFAKNGGILKKSQNTDYGGGILNYSPMLKPPLIKPTLTRQAPLSTDM